MAHALNHRSLLAFEKTSTQEGNLVLDCARSLRLAAAGGAAQPLLRGKKIGLFSDPQANDDAGRFRRAATELGAHVAQIRSSLSALSSPEEIRYTARMLGRLYDAVECEGMPLALVQQVSEHAGIPVFNGLASRTHSIAGLADRLDGEGDLEDKRRLILQATLLCSIG